MKLISEQSKEGSPLQRERTEFQVQRTGLINDFSVAAEDMRSEQMDKACDEIQLINRFIESLNRIEAKNEADQQASTPRFSVNSLFLYECFEKLTMDERENLVFITGAEVAGVFVLDQMAEFEHETRTVTSVVANPRATHRLLIKLEEFGHRLLGHFHSHPGEGPDSTHPSGIDQQFQQRLESGGHFAVAAIFSRDGYVRFFRLDEEFELQIHGTGVERHDNNVYRLTAIPPVEGRNRPRRIRPSDKNPGLRPGDILGI